MSKNKLNQEISNDLDEFAKKINALNASIRQYHKLDEEIKEINNMTMQNDNTVSESTFSEQIAKRKDNPGGVKILGTKPTKEEKQEEIHFVESYRKDLQRRDLFTSGDTTDKYVHKYLDRQQKNGLKYELIGEGNLWKVAKETQKNDALYQIKEKINDLEQYTGKGIEEIFEGEFAKELANLKNKEYGEMNKYERADNTDGLSKENTVKTTKQLLRGVGKRVFTLKQDKRKSGLSRFDGIEPTFRKNKERKYINQVIEKIEKEIMERDEKSGTKHPDEKHQLNTQKHEKGKGRDLD